jgi:TolB protein
VEGRRRVRRREVQGLPRQDRVPALRGLQRQDPSLTKTYPRQGTDTRKIVHRWCNEVFKFYTGDPGFFGSQIVFTGKSKGSPDVIYAMDFDGANAYAVSHNSATNILPAWSPSGGQIAYTSFMRSNPDLYIAPAGGGRPKKVSAQRGMNTGASWSPDGSKLAITLSKDGNPEIYIINATDGSVVKRLTNDKAIDTSPAWSPDGSTIAFVIDRTGGTEIYTVSASGGAARGSPSTQLQHHARVVARQRQARHRLHHARRRQLRHRHARPRHQGDDASHRTKARTKSHRFAEQPRGRFRPARPRRVHREHKRHRRRHAWTGAATGVDWGPGPGAVARLRGPVASTDHVG